VRSAGAAALALALAGAAAGPAAADDGVTVATTFTPIELVFSATETGAGSSQLVASITDALEARTTAASACFVKRKVPDGNALALVVVDKKGKTTKVAVGGSGDAALDKCLEKAIKPTAWPVSSGGGAVALSIVGKPHAVPRPQTETGSPVEADLGSPVKPDEASGRVSGGATVTLGTANGGTATYAQGVMKKLQGGAGAFRLCYQKALRTSPKLSGALAITFTIGGDGKVVAAKADPSLSAEVDGCIIKSIKAMTFSSPPDGNAVDIRLPFNLTP
jgi:hypothetical protein